MGKYLIDLDTGTKHEGGHHGGMTTCKGKHGVPFENHEVHNMPNGTLRFTEVVDCLKCIALRLTPTMLAKFIRGEDYLKGT